MGGDVGPDPETAVGEGDVVVDDEGDEGGADVVVGVGAGAGAGGGVGFGKMASLRNGVMAMRGIDVQPRDLFSYIRRP